MLALKNKKNNRVHLNGVVSSFLCDYWEDSSGVEQIKERETNDKQSLKKTFGKRSRKKLSLRLVLTRKQRAWEMSLEQRAKSLCFLKL